MPGHGIPEFAHFAAEYGWIAAFMMILAGIGVYKLGVSWNKRFDRIDKATVLLEQISQAHLGASGEHIKHHDHYRSVQTMLEEITKLLGDHDGAAQIHYVDVKRLTDEEHWKNCAVDKCPNLPKLLADLRLLTERFAAAEKQAASTQLQTNANLEKLAEEMQLLAREIIATLRSFKSGGSDNG